MVAKQEKINLIDFQQRFATEEAYRQYLFQKRWPDGFKCPRCGHNRCYEIITRNLYECSRCHYQASVTAGTIVEKTHTKLKIWFWTFYLVAHDRRGRSATSLSEELGISYIKKAAMNNNPNIFGL
ncbi:MAG: Transposase zinc-ribbon domain protein [Pelotomaculum sp. PtaU1.Bin035]|nr:MAG: Transposase zinc-ribbon domain protein [Pelotomaculum sp. PtaU1.Bin035]